MVRFGLNIPCVVCKMVWYVVIIIAVVAKYFILVITSVSNILNILSLNCVVTSCQPISKIREIGEIREIRENPGEIQEKEQWKFSEKCSEKSIKTWKLRLYQFLNDITATFWSCVYSKQRKSECKQTYTENIKVITSSSNSSSNSTTFFHSKNRLSINNYFMGQWC